MNSLLRPRHETQSEMIMMNHAIIRLRIRISAFRGSFKCEMSYESFDIPLPAGLRMITVVMITVMP